MSVWVVIIYHSNRKISGTFTGKASLTMLFLSCSKANAVCYVWACYLLLFTTVGNFLKVKLVDSPYGYKFYN